MKISIVGSNGFIGRNLYEQLENIRTQKARWYTLPPEFILCGDNNVPSQDLCDADVWFFIYDRDGGHYSEIVSKYFSEIDKVQQRKIIFVYTVDDEAKALSDIEKIECQLSKFSFNSVKLPHVFGKWSSPEENVIMRMIIDAALGKNISQETDDTCLDFVYIDDVVDGLIKCLVDYDHCKWGTVITSQVYSNTIDELASIINSFHDERIGLQVPRVSDLLVKALYSTYLSYISDDDVTYSLKMNVDDRGSFTEFIKTHNHGQISINISKPGIVKGQHWHNNRVEKFVVVSGHGLLQQRQIGLDENGQPYPVLNNYVSSDKLEVVEVRPGFTHNLINMSDTENLVTIIWGNDCFDPNRPDTYFEPVEIK